MKDKCDNCKSINLSYDSALGELICNDCGLVMEENLVQELESEKRSVFRNKKIKRNFSSGYQRDKKKENYYQDSKIKEFLTEIYALENLLKEITGEEWESIKKKTMDFLKYNYENNLPKTMEKKVLIWAILISVFETEIIHLENQNKLSESRKYKIALNTLSDQNQDLYQKAEKMRDKLLPIMAEIVNNKLNLEKGIEWGTYIINLSKIDPKSKNINKKGLHKLFSKESMLVPHEEAGGEIIEKRIKLWEDEVCNAAVTAARMFIQAHLIADKEIGKKEGLLCACAYLVCKQSNLKPLPLDMWAQFFDISARCLDGRIKDIKETSVPETLQQPPMETKIQDKKLLLFEKAQKQD